MYTVLLWGSLSLHGISFGLEFVFWFILSAFSLQNWHDIFFFLMPSYISPTSSYVAASWQRCWIVGGLKQTCYSMTVEHRIKITQSTGHSISHYRIRRQLQALLTDPSFPRAQGCLDPKFHFFAMWKLQGEVGEIMVFAVSHPSTFLVQWNVYLQLVF